MTEGDKKHQVSPSASVSSVDLPARDKPTGCDGVRSHELKTWPEPFAAIVSGAKRYEIRVDDRGFAVGDVLHLWEYDRKRSPVEAERYTGRYTKRRVTYMTHGGQWGLPTELCVMSIEAA